ncbi:MAG: Na+/H+ antiporter subunit D [Micrococcaceae bacterium]
MTLNALIPLPVMLPIFGAAINFLFFRRPRIQRAITLIAIIITLMLEFYMLTQVDKQGTQVFHIGGWQSPFGISLVVDRFSAMLMVISTLVTLLVLFYATAQSDYTDDQDSPVSIFYPVYLILLAGVSDAFISGDLFNLYVGFEILLTASYVLLTMGGTSERLRAGASYIVVSVISSFIFLMAIGMIYAATGTVNMAQLSLRLAELPVPTQYMLQAMLLVAFGIKAAVFPLSFWLPDSYPIAAAPITAVFAGLLTKVGIYSIIRTETLLFPQHNLSNLLIVAASLTMVLGIMGALAQDDLKRILSFTLISHVGYMLLGVSMHNVTGLTGTLYYTMHHIVIQVALFLIAGLISIKTGTTSLSELGGLAKSAPLLSVLYFATAMNLGGIPPGSGFLGKVIILKSVIETQMTPLRVIAVICALVGSLLTLYAVARIWNRAFLRPATAVANVSDTVLNVNKLKPSMWTPTILLVAVSVSFTVYAQPMFSLSERAAKDMLNPQSYISLQQLQEVQSPNAH